MSTLTLSAAEAKLLGQHIVGSKSFGPLTVNYNIDLSIPQVSANATLYGISIGSVVINPQHPTAVIGGNVGVGKAEITLTADFATRTLRYKIEVEAMGHVIYAGQGILFSW